MDSPSDLADLAAAQLAAAGSLMPVDQEDQEDVDGADLAPIAWMYQTATLESNYARLSVTLHSGHDVPVVPVWYDPDATLVLAVPARVAPWLTSHLVRLGDIDTGAPSEDGQCTAAVFFRANPSAAHSLSPAGDTTMWALDQRWPAAEALCTVEVAEDVPLPAHGAALEFDTSHSLPPSEVSVSPQELDAALGGAFLQGPWFGYAALVYPPLEPEPAGAETGPDAAEAEAEPALPEPPTQTLPALGFQSAHSASLSQQPLPAFPGGKGPGTTQAMAGLRVQAAAVVLVPATDTEEPAGLAAEQRGRPAARAPGKPPRPQRRLRGPGPTVLSPYAKDRPLAKWPTCTSAWSPIKSKCKRR